MNGYIVAKTGIKEWVTPLASSDPQVVSRMLEVDFAEREYGNT